MSYVIFGGKGQLGRKFVNKFISFGAKFSSYDIDNCDITDINEVFKVVKKDKPKFIINCAAYNLVDEAEKDYKLAYQINQAGARNIAIAARELRTYLVHYSTDYVFDGTQDEPYSETDDVNPINHYGMSKLRGEEAVMDVLDDYLILRLSWVYGKGQQNFIHKLSQWAENNQELNISQNEYSVPTSVNLIVDATLKALKKNLAGLYHLTSSGSASRLEWAREIVRLKGIDVKLNPVDIDYFNLPAKRPLNSAMFNGRISSLIGELPHWKADLEGFLL
ncbi:MAG: dTDP-4-dehydrorhamnose reductase [Candidatus Kapabacteria bacterium]|nr:dTDP-4-dehydrorhamnose reductase [Ignavibacteriota bacterium]MCW5884613.1 dTDP-4-dehydrorhamnose reductase [Candidatus Kapabacteria bacterium]